MASHCPSCGRVLGPVAAPAESPCCAATRRDQQAPEAFDPFAPEDFGVAVAAPAAKDGEPSSAADGEISAALLTLRPRLVPVPPPPTPPVVSGAASPQLAPDLADAPRERSRRLPAGIRLVISRRGRRPAPRRADSDEVLPTAGPVDAPVSLPAPPPPAATPAAPPAALTLPPVESLPAAAVAHAPTPAPVSRPTLSLRGLQEGIAPVALNAPRFLGVFGPLGQAHLVADPSATSAVEATNPIIAPRARALTPPTPPTPAAALPPRSAPSPSAPFSLPFDALATVSPETVREDDPASASTAPALEAAASATPAPAPAPAALPRPRPAEPIRPRSPNAPTRADAREPAPSESAPPRHRIDARAWGQAAAEALTRLAPIPTALPPGFAWIVAIAGAALLLWLAPPLAGVFLAGLGLVVIRRAEADGGGDESKSQARVAEALGWGGLAASLASLALGLAAARNVVLLLPSSPIPWPDALFVPGALLGLVLAALAGAHLAARRHAPFLAGMAGPSVAMALVAGVGLRWGGLMVAGSALCAAASWGCWQRYVTRELRGALLAWASVGGLAMLAAIGAVAWGYRPLPLAGALAAGLLTFAGIGASARLARGYEQAQQRLARAVASVTIALLAGMLVLASRAVGLPLATGLALTPLAAVGAGLAAMLQRQRGMLRIETPWLPRDARVAAAASVMLAVIGLAWPALGANPWTLALLFAALGTYCAVERALDGPAFTGAASALFLVAAICAGLAGLAVPLPWLAPVAATLIAATGLLCPRLPGRLTREAWAPMALAALGACLVAGLVACAFGHVAAGLAGAAAAALAPLVLAGRRGVADLVHSLLAGQLPEGRRASAVAALQLGVLAFLPLAPLVTLGLWPWAAPVLAAEALVATLVSRWRPTLLHPASWLVVGSLALLPLGAHPGGWLPGLAALSLLAVTGGVEFAGSRNSARGTHRLSAELLAGAGLGTVAWAGAGLSVAPIVLLGAAVAAQVIESIVGDALLARALRRASGVAWLAAAIIGLARAAVDPRQGAVLLAGSAVTGGLLFLLRRERWTLLVGGLSLAAAISCGLIIVGAGLLDHPTLHAAPLAGVLIAWGTLESRRGARASEWLLLGLGALAAALALEAHAPGSPALLRVIATLAGLGMAAAGFVSRHRVPLQVGAVLLAVEALWLLGEGIAWSLDHPVAGVVSVAVAAAALGGLLARLSWRAGGSASLWMAWSSDMARIRAAWSTWR